MNMVIKILSTIVCLYLNTLAFPRNHCCNVNATVRSVYIVELHFSVDNVFVSPEAAKLIQVFVRSTQFFFNQIWIFSGQIFIQFPSIKFDVNPPSGSCVDTCGRTDGREERSYQELFAAMRTCLNIVVSPHCQFLLFVVTVQGRNL